MLSIGFRMGVTEAWLQVNQQASSRDRISLTAHSGAASIGRKGFNSAPDCAGPQIYPIGRVKHLDTDY